MADRVDELIRRRARVLGPVQRQFYDFPFWPVRGSGVWLHDAQGKAYLDAYNNVPHVGHSDTDVTAAVAHQMELLNTHTRYLDATIVEYAERLLATLPPELDVCVFVCSGSEANELAGRLARAASGGSGFIASAHAYHGNTAFLSALDGMQPNAPQAHFVATVPGPEDARDFDAACAMAIAALEDRGLAVAGAFVDTCFANEGLQPPQPLQVQAAMARVSASGGLYIADEVQVGLGRLGDVMWGFESFGVVPDIVTMGKPLGNGYPIGAVATRREILEAFSRTGRYFNTFGGTPVACTAGLAVLDVLERRSLQAQARQVGAYLAERLAGLVRTAPELGGVRGRGFFQGVAIKDPRSGTAAPERARAVMNEMARRGVLVGLTGPQRSILKIRPPMVFEREHAELLVGTLAAVLASCRDGDRFDH
jgi:4-aminobutyrate aminotransferase-like enzyme